MPLDALGLALAAAVVHALFALRIAPAAPVAAVRECSVLIAVALAAVFLRERVSPWHAAGAAGVALLAV